MHTFLTTALDLAKNRRGFCAPNPAVGAVLVKDQQIIASGYHYASGYPHAEVKTLEKIDPALIQNATLYVTLEPCCHRNKKTPPCTDLLIQSGIKKVVYGFQDPNPAVAGQSKKILAAAGIECIHSPLAEIDVFYQSYAHWWQTGTPFVTAKLAMSLDAKIAGEQGLRVNITGPEAQQFTHEQRRRADAILTTAKTIIADDPLLNVRLTGEPQRKPIYILDRNLTTPINAKIFTTAERVTLFCDQQITAEKMQAYQNLGARCIPVSSEQQKLSLPAILKTIGQDGIHDLWIEAGGSCFSAFARMGLLQQAYIYIAPKLLGTTAQNAFAGPTDLFSQATHFAWQTLGQDSVCKITFSQDLRAQVLQN